MTQSSASAVPLPTDAGSTRMAARQPRAAERWPGWAAGVPGDGRVVAATEAITGSASASGSPTSCTVRDVSLAS